MPEWKGNRDGWWYSDDALDASGSISVASRPLVFELSVQSVSGGVLTAARLLSLLRLTVRDFRDCEVWCSIDRFTAAVLEQLSEEGSVRWELVEHPYSRDARIIEVVPETASAADARPENTVLPYATRESVPTPSWYPLWSLVVSALALVFMVGPFPFDAYKRHRIGTVASVLALILAIGAYWQPGVVKRPMAHAALVVAGLLAVGLFLFMPL